jgi:hypothetical protein
MNARTRRDRLRRWATGIGRYLESGALIELLPDFQHKPLDACAILYAIPATAVLGAILVTGFLGGAICAHVRIGELGSPPEIIALLLGAMTWGGLYARDPRFRAILPRIR